MKSSDDARLAKNSQGWVDITWVENFLRGKTPRGAQLTVRDGLVEDEAYWFRRAVENGLFRFRLCVPGCPRRERSREVGPDEFVPTAGRPALRHLFSLSLPPRLNREYLPHIAAVGRLVLGEGYSQDRSAFSRYRRFKRDLLHKREGQAYESDAEFYDQADGVWLHVEVKRGREETERLAASIEAATGLRDLPPRLAKELEYVLDLTPRYLWLAGPGAIDPALHVYEVRVQGLNASLAKLDALPPPPL